MEWTESHLRFTIFVKQVWRHFKIAQIKLSWISKGDINYWNGTHHAIVPFGAVLDSNFKVNELLTYGFTNFLRIFKQSELVLFVFMFLFEKNWNKVLLDQKLSRTIQILKAYCVSNWLSIVVQQLSGILNPTSTCL